MNRGIRNQGRYPNVSQSHQLPATKIPQQPHDLNYVPTSDVKFYNIHSEAQLRTTSSEVWSQSSFPPPAPPEQNHNPLPPPPSTGYWQQPLYSTEPVNVATSHDPWKWTVDNSSHDVNNQYEQPPTNFQVPNTWQQNSTPYQPSSDAQVNNPYIHQPPISSGLANSAYSSHFAPWNPPSMDPDPHVAANDSQTQSWPDSTTLSNSHSQWQNFNHENSESQNVFWSYGVQQNAQPSQWPSEGFPQHTNVGSVLTSNWNDQAESSTVVTDKPSQVDCNYPQGNGDNNVKCSRENVYNSEHNIHDISCKNVDTVDIQSKNDTLEHLEVADNYVAPHDDGVNLAKKEIVEEEYKSDSSLSAFFNNDIQDQVSAEENASPEMSSERNSRSNSVTGCEMELQIPCCVSSPLTANGKSSCVSELSGYVIQENKGFIQNESIGSFAEEVNLESSSNPAGSPEDSPNLEVPEPSPSSNSSSKISSLSSTSQHTKTTLTADLESSHEPPNQQVPHGSEESVNMPLSECENSVKISQEESSPLNRQVPVITKDSATSSSERDKVVIRAREESPFKPPSKLLNSKGLVVQQEISPLVPVSKSPGVDGMRCDQGVNMETVPDNLERPPDTEEQKKQSSWSTSLHRHHARNHVDSSPSTSLWDSPDIPCVTLVPADPTPPVVHKHEERQPSLPVAKDSDISAARTVPQMTESPGIGGNEDKQNSRSQAYSEPVIRSSESPATPVAVPAFTSHNQTTTQPGSTYSPAAVTSENCKLNQARPAEHTSGLQSIRRSSSEFQNLSFPESIPANSAQFSVPTETVSSSSSLYRENKPPNSSSEFESPRHNGNMSQGSLEQFPHPPGHRLADNRCASFDERNYYAEKDRSRPSSRMSLHGTADEPSYHERDYRRPCPPFYDRVPSRMSESEAMRTGRHGQYPYYEQQYYDDRYASYHRDDDYYRSRNYKGFEYDPYRQDRHPYYAYYDPYRYGYSSYNYGFYDELYRNDPRYKQQMEERYRQYYAKLGYDTDQERSSVHSGRSSANELAKEMPARYAEPDGDSNESEYSAYNQQYYGYDEYSSKPSSADLSSEQITVTAAARLTPAKFSCAHPICNFSSSGVLVTVIPTQLGSMQAAPVEFHDIQVLMETTESFEELKQYQGPLIRGKTHKNDIIEFCLQKVKYFAAKKDLPDRESYILLWELMVLLLRQNGSVAGSDIAELLLKDHEVLRPASISKPNVETPQGDGALPDVGEPSNQVASGDTSSPDEGIVVSHDKSILNPSASIDVDKVTRKFREFLLFGHKKDALEWAMKHGLWGHALFLASKMDLRTYANVMTRFANSLTLNDPLQTLYQLMSGRQPAAVTCCVDKKWGDWRPHLAMILSNPSSHTEVDLRSITTLGDTLANNGCLPAAHFCYLMAQVEFGTYSRKSSKMVLLSSNHLLPFQEFATNEAIQCTEIYEYAQSLANPGFMLPHLQAYKFIYATRLAEHGFLQEALHYCEIISHHFQQNTDLFSIGFIDEVLKLATKLKFHDPIFIQGQGEWEDQNDPEWLQNLTFLLQNCKDGAVQSFADYGSAISNLPAESNLQEYGLESGDDFGTNQVASDVDTQNQTCYSQPPVQQNFYQQNNWVAQDNTQHPEQESHGIVPNQETTQYETDLTTNQWNVSSEQPSTFEDLEKSTAEQVSSPISSQGNASFDYYGTSIQQEHVSRQTSRERTNSSSSVGTVVDRRSSTLSSGSGYGIRSPPTTTRGAKEETQRVEKKEEKPKSQAGRAWLGGIFSKLIPKGPNQMILPDDKNPTIIWDSTKNCWINTDSNEEDEINKPAAPPTDTELMEHKTSPDLPHSSPQPPVSSSSTVNRFQRPKTRGMRQNYVDILNPGGTTNKPVPASDALFPPPPPPPPQSQTSASKFFVPSVPTASEDQPVDFVSTNYSPFNASSSLENEDGCASGSPLMFDPAEFESRKSSISSLRHSVGPAGRRTYPT